MEQVEILMRHVKEVGRNAAQSANERVEGGGGGEFMSEAEGKRERKRRKTRLNGVFCTGDC